MITKLLAACLIAFATFSMVGCNTVEGAGQDVEDLGEGVQDAAD